MNSKAFKKLLTGSGGFTLTEVLVSMAILSLVLGIAGSAIFQVLSIERSWKGAVLATRDWRHAESWFASDAINAETTDLVAGEEPTPGVTLTWSDSSGVPHTASYTLSGTNLLRDFDGVQVTVARRVVSAGFSLSGKLLTLDMETAADSGATETASLKTYLRMLK